ncbi:metallophosphoesterase [Nigerium massiliense]|uniref:metallophosphoesterase n=1 Tax=Nigerium massiliense TaxID=1522317 RepID=UPI000693DB42|nr:metallophosphoesterase [Nigerium massiliense]
MYAFPAPEFTLAHLSDSHIRAAADPLVGGRVDSRATTSRALDVLTSWDQPVDAWLFSGDLSDDGSPDSYAWLRRQVEDAAASVGVPVLWLNGNHDERAAFRAGLLGQAPSEEPYNAEHRVGDVRFLLLDTNLPGRPEGLVADSSLGWLADRLAEPDPPLGTVLVMHHTPLPPLQTAAGLWPLTNPQPVAEAVRGSGVRLILGGHFHQPSHGTFAGIPVSGATSLTYTQDLTDGLTLRGQDAGQGFALVQLYPADVMSTTVGLTRGALVHQRITPADTAKLRKS